jgi:hypothetical protein
MKKISSKIIISFLLAIFLFGGIGFGVGKDNNNITIQIGAEKVLAAGGAEACGPEPVPANPSAPAYITWRKCVADAAAGIAAESLETNGWFQFKQTFKNMPGVFADKAVKTAVAVVGGFLQLIIIPVLGVILRIMAALLDQSIQFALNSVHISDVNDSIVIVWALIRNIFNITFIFILLWSAIQMIIGVASANAKKVIANVIIAALLINFSLFITRILIDAGNILATNMYNLATTNTTGSYVSISTTIMNIMGISGLFASTGADSVFSTSFFIVSVLQVITITTAIITLSYVMILMLVRNVMLIFLLVLSPIGFMGSVIPKIEEYSKMWWENLYGQVFVAPIFLIFFYLITIIGNKLTENLSAMMVTGDSGTGATTISSSGDYVQYFKYILIIILLFAAVKITKKMSGVVGEMAGKVGSFAVGAALGAATGGLALAGRTAIGGMAAKTASWGALANADAKGGLGGYAARMALKSANYTSKASFDARNTASFKGATDFIGDQTGIKVDYARGANIQKGGYIATKEKKEKEMETRAKELANVDALKVDSWHDLKQADVDAEIMKKKSKATMESALLALSIQTKRDDLLARKDTITAKERTKIEGEIDKLNEEKSLHDKFKDYDDPKKTSAADKMELEETVRRNLAKEKTEKAADARLISVAGNNSLANKRAASVVRGFKKANSKEKNEHDELLKEISKNTKPKP